MFSDMSQLSYVTLGLILCYTRVTLGSLLEYEGDLRVTLVSLSVDEDGLDVTLVSIWDT